VDYAPQQTAAKGWALIEKQLKEMNGQGDVSGIRSRLDRIKAGERDLYY